jgi:hypothetical protein
MGRADLRASGRHGDGERQKTFTSRVCTSGRVCTDEVARCGGVGPLKTLGTISVSALLLAILALAALETWIEYAARRGPPEVAAGVERVEPGLPPGAESSPTP